MGAQVLGSFGCNEVVTALSARTRPHVSRSKYCSLVAQRHSINGEWFLAPPLAAALTDLQAEARS